MAAPRHAVKVNPRFPVRVNMADPYNGAPDNIALAWNLFQPDPIVGPEPVFSVASPNYDENGNNIGLNPRIDAGKGLWMGGQVQNLLPTGAAYSATWGKTNCTVAGNTATISGTSARHYLYFATTPYTAGVSYTASYRIKKSGGQRFVQITGQEVAFGVGQYANFDLELGVVAYSTGCTAQIIPDVDGFYWCHFTAVATTTTASVSPYVCFTNDGTSSRLPIYTGDGIASLEIDRWMVSATAYPVPYVPPGATQLTNAATTGGNGTNIPLDAGLLKCFGNGVVPAVCTTMAEHYMGVGSADLPQNSYVSINMMSCKDVNDELLCAYGYNNSTQAIARSKDGTGVIDKVASWSANEIHRRYVQTNSDGTKFRVGYQRFSSAMVEITSGIQWSHTGAESTWAAFDGSFNPLTYLRMCLNVTVPIWGRKLVVANKSLSAAEISDAWGLVS